MKLATQVQILDKAAVCISHNTHSLGKGINPVIRRPALDKWGRFTLFNLGMATHLGEEKLEI